MCGVGTVLQGHANSLFITLRVSTSTIFTPHGQHPLAPSPPHHPPSPQLLCLQNLHHHPLQHNAKFATLIVSLSHSVSHTKTHTHAYTHSFFIHESANLSLSFLPSFFWRQTLVPKLLPEYPPTIAATRKPVRPAHARAPRQRSFLCRCFSLAGRGGSRAKSRGIFFACFH